MNSVFSFVTGLLTAALSLLGFVQQHPELPPATRDQAQQVAQQAITTAGDVLANQNAAASKQFAATPTSGTAPLTVRFSQTATDDYRASIDYGDGTKGTCTDCTSKFVHTYTAPGTYTVKLGSLTGTDGATRPPLGTLTINVSTGSGASQSVSVPGMTKYTDSDFGFSFWYPSGWTVTPSTKSPSMYSSQGFVKSLSVSNGTKSILVSEFNTSSGLTFSAAKWNERVYFDSTQHAWMHSVDGTIDLGTTGAKTTYSDVSVNTMGGLHIIQKEIIPLSAHNFVVVSDQGTGDPQPLSKTILATDPSVATPVSAAQQTATIQAEASAYSNNSPVQPAPANTTTTNGQTYTNSDYGFSVNYDPSVFKTNTDTSGYMGKPNYTNTLLSLFYGAGSITFRGDKTTTYEDCLRNSTDTKNVTPLVINGITFYKSGTGEAGLGHSLHVDTYRTYYNGACYSIHTWIESDRTVDGSYTDTTKEKKNLQDVLNTFKFNVPQTRPTLHASAEPDWKTYTGTGMPVSFTYPGNYVIQESADNGYGNEINITAGSKVGSDIVPGDSFTSAITIQKSLITSNNTLQKNLDFDAANKQNYYQPMTVGGISGFFGGDINGPGLTNHAVINLQKGNYTYRILLYGPFPTSMYNNFVNSFKFTN